MAPGRRNSRNCEIVHERNLRYFNTPAIPSHTTPFTGKQQYQTGQLASMGYPVDHFVLFAARNCLYATKVDNLWNPGQQEEAIKASNTARLFFFLALGGGVLALIIGFISDLTSMMLGGGYY